MSKRTWHELHDDATTETDPVHPWTTIFSQGGVATPHQQEPEEFDSLKNYYISRWSDGFWGWFGYGGSIF